MSSPDDWLVVLKARLRIATDSQLEAYIHALEEERTRRIKAAYGPSVYGYKVLNPTTVSTITIEHNGK